ncbi:MAG: formate dehydrogenase accessory sulfurtransferase FdhD [Verrucomicrobia bacterium]|nr:formate dehydrogenase accessory sulfurtransferase FdhD [Verrucomicrobiota bacterium]
MPEGSIQDYGVQRYHSGGSAPEFNRDQLAVEEPLEIRVAFRRNGVAVTRPVSVTMRTPGHDPALAVGFLFTEGVIPSPEAVMGVETSPERGASIVVHLNRPVALKQLERHFFAASSCGICGKASLEAVKLNRDVILPEGRPRWRAAGLLKIPERVQEAQSTFHATGGLHAAALLGADHEVWTVREDIGRHNAVDKVIGHALITGRYDLSGALLFVSGRAGFELVQKAIMASIPAMAAVGAPSSLAVDLARRYGFTLVGFLRNGRFNVYSGFARIEDHVPCGV